MKAFPALIACSLLLGLPNTVSAKKPAQQDQMPLDMNDLMRASPKYYEAGQLEENCLNGMAWKQESCGTYVMGVIDGLDQASTDRNMKPDFCLPREFNGSDVLDTMRKNYERVMSMSGETAASHVHRVLKLTFPCPENVNQ